MSRFKRILSAVLLTVALVGSTAATTSGSTVLAGGGPRICC